MISSPKNLGLEYLYCTSMDELGQAVSWAQLCAYTLTHGPNKRLTRSEQSPSVLLVQSCIHESGVRATKRQPGKSSGALVCY
jgi:hypothetical protein